MTLFQGFATFQDESASYQTALLNTFTDLYTPIKDSQDYQRVIGIITELQFFIALEEKRIFDYLQNRRLMPTPP
jgi:hypothetical protein